ncbi:MAG: hypothetical protein ACERKK_01630 [Poseidonibacter sp.]|uniref:hypothetical protein n=1 Tax=Poseidonibacter sp. TaxID=2321188 RepID=UPI00359E9AD1
MKYEELISELCDVIKESENNADLIYEDLESIQQTLSDSDICTTKKADISNKIENSLGLLQHQDLHRQKIERVVNFVCEHNNIDRGKYNLASSAKSIGSDDVLSEDELEELLKSMQS